METLTRFKRKPFFVTGVMVTEENMAEVAEWCGGKVFSKAPAGGKAAFYIEVPVAPRPRNKFQTQAHVGYWVLVSNARFKVYTPEALTQSFESVGEFGVKSSDERIVERLKQINAEDASARFQNPSIEHLVKESS